MVRETKDSLRAGAAVEADSWPKWKAAKTDGTLEMNDRARP